MNLGQFAVENGLATARWMDTSQGQPGVSVQHGFNPAGKSAAERYGIGFGEIFTYVESQHVGPHTGDRDHIAVAQLYAEALGLDEITPWDIWDLNLVAGLTEYAIQAMNAKGLKTPDEKGAGEGGDGGELEREVSALKAEVARLRGRIDSAHSTAARGLEAINQLAGHEGGGRVAVSARSYLRQLNEF